MIARLRLTFPTLLFLVFLAASARAEVKVGPWLPLFKGIEHAVGEADAKEPRLQKANALRIDLADPDIRFLATPHSGPLETVAQTASQFLVQHGLQVAANANFFRPLSGLPLPVDLAGLCVSEGKVVSPPASGVGSVVLRITRDNRASFATTTETYDASGIWTAVAGNAFVVADGRNVGGVGSSHPRTAVGISRDGRHLVLLTIDGRQRGFSEGATDQDTGAWLLRFGAHNGINLDGGGSTTMVMSDGKGGAKLLNSPIHGSKPGTQRLNGNHLGVFARPLGKE